MTHSKVPVLIQALQNPDLYPHPVRDFTVIETHISWVLLTGLFAYKIKKNLDLGFLDFSSLEKRHHYCLEELRLDSRLAPGIYLEVIAIRGSEAQPELNGSGKIVEYYAVKLRQFKHDNTFDQLLARDQLTLAHIKQTAEIIANFHDRIDCAADATKFGAAETIMQPVRENFRQELPRNDMTEQARIFEFLADWSEQECASNLACFERRKQAGFIRECHGDLHLGNIALIDDKVVPFDGIEFNPSLYWIDVISEIAFLVMDLQDWQRPDLAYQFLNEYLQHSGDYSGLQLLRFYLVYRAMVRVKVSAIVFHQSTTAKEQQLALEDFNSYIQLAKQYTRLTTPCLMIMHGLSGSGKSWIAERIIDRYPVIRIRSDVERKRLFNLPATDRSHSEIASGLYKNRVSDQTYQRLLQLAKEILSNGFSVVVDATFLKKQQREQFWQLAHQLSLSFQIIRTHAKKPTLLQRLQARVKQVDNVSDADQQVLEHQLTILEPLSDEEFNFALDIATTYDANCSKLWALLENCNQPAHTK